MASHPVHPLRIQKGTPNASPIKVGSSVPRALSELAPTEKRRNSPSFTQPTKKMSLNQDSSPFQSSPFNASEGNSSPRLFWQGRDPGTPSRFNSENSLFAQRESSPSPTRRSSIEKLQRASRVKNSNMFAREQKQEYDPASVPVIERPLAKQVQGNAYGGSGLEGLRSEERASPWSHKRSESTTHLPLYTPTKTPLSSNDNGFAHARSPSKDQVSPTKSSLSSRNFNSKAKFDFESSTRSEENSSDERELPEGRSLHRHAKSVTFDAAPPQINEYEMTTPDLSSICTGSRENSYELTDEDDEDHYDRSESAERDDSFDASLEDTEKTPVVGPDDWRHASPSTQYGAQSSHLEDPFHGPEGSPMPDAIPSSQILTRSTHGRSDSGDHRPLPPLPGGMMNDLTASQSGKGISTAAERVSSAQRGLPPPPRPASISKSELQSMSGGKMSLEERLRLMMTQEDDKPRTAAEEQRERRMRRAGPRERGSATPERESGTIPIHEDEHEEDDTLGDLSALGEYQLPPRISRESILRKVNGEDNIGRDSDSDYNFSSPAPSSSPQRTEFPDPDIPIPSTEDSIVEIQEGVDENRLMKPDPLAEDDLDVYSITDLYHDRPESRDEQYSPLGTMIQHDLRRSEDEESQYSEPTPANQSAELVLNKSPQTPRQTTPVQHATDPVKQYEQMSLPELGGFLTNNDFGLSLQSYMRPCPLTTAEEDEKKHPIFSQSLQSVYRPVTPPSAHPVSRPEYDGSGWGPEEEQSEPSTPDSVIRHPMPPSPPRDSPSIPDQVATIKSAAGSKLKTRPSATPADLMAMRDARRQISGELPNIPPIPARHRNRPSLNLDQGFSLSDSGGEMEDLVRKNSLKKKSLTLDIGGDLGLSLDKDFDRVIEAQKVAFSLSSSPPALHNPWNGQVTSNYSLNKELDANITPRIQRGYLMRQNTKLVVASSDVDKSVDRVTRSAGNSPIKQERPQSWTVEPWNGQIRRKSVRDNGSPRKKMISGPVPPLPGQESNVQGLAALTEEEPTSDPITDDAGERGRLFVKVLGVKDLDLPLPKNERTWFSLTLDNGVHCVTTAWLELGKNAPIGQEFELVVPNDLEFQLTLNVKLEKPEPKRVIDSPIKSSKVQKQSTFSRVFASPKKRKELEMRQKEEQSRAAQEKLRDAQAKRQQPTAWDLLSPLVAGDGSFGRSYVCLKDHESRCYGRPYIADMPCFNEWATEEANATSSVKSKRGNTHVQRRAPYKVGKLELQLLFVPKPKGALEDDMPKSMNSCIRELKEAEAAMARSFEGHLSQQGGDCPYWRRRFFKLTGSKLTAFHESTGQPRATINLANASKLIDDRRSLTQKETTGKGGSRRKSGFAEEEEGYMFVEEGFRIRFANGEVIDFYADSAKDKEGWMVVLDQCIGKSTGDGNKGGGTGKWCQAVLKREESLMRKKGSQQQGRKPSGQNARTGHQRTKSMII